MKSSRANIRKGIKNRARSTTMIEIVKPPSDFRAYRVVILPNGITAMLISDAPESDNFDGENMETDDSLLDEGEAAAALCIGVGSFSDLPEIPGFAHFMEHNSDPSPHDMSYWCTVLVAFMFQVKMTVFTKLSDMQSETIEKINRAFVVFMGSKKYPKENYWDEFLANNGGESNAWTDCERTCFFFVCHQNSFRTALDIFAQFFISPLFNKQSVDREIMAVDNEWRMLASNDKERMRNIMSFELVEEGHPMGKFMAGNIKSLKEDPEKNNINVYEQLRSFYLRMYSAHYMTLVLHSVETLDTMEDHIIKMFTKIRNNDIPRPKFIKSPFQERNLNKLIRVRRLSCKEVHNWVEIFSEEHSKIADEAQSGQPVQITTDASFEVIPMSDIHKMEIVWALPPLMEHYRARVIEFLALLLGHEGRGSILSFLRKKHLALDITSGNDFTGFTHNSTWSAFILSFKLTDLGTTNYVEVLKTVFQYINMLKKNLPAHVFEEQKHIQETKYIFKEQESIYNYVEELAENMHLFPPEHYLCGRTLFFEYNEQLIQDCLDFLRPQGMLVMLFNKKYSNIPCLNEETWLGVKYKVDDIDSELIKELTSLEPNPELLMPDPNPYIATNFNLLKVIRPTKFPVVVLDENGCRMWYKKDNKYAMPNAFVYLNFVSSTITKTSQNVALSDIFLTMLLHKLTETLFNATLAGYEYSVEGTPEGIIFVLGGYSEKIKLVTQDTLRVFLELEINDDSFETVVAHLKQVYINELIKPVELARAVRYSLLELKNISVLERYEQMNSISYEMLLVFIQEFYSHLFVEGFVTGNLRPEDAIDIGRMLQSLVVKSLPESEFPKPCMMVLPVGDFKCFLQAINKEDTNSCVVHYFQLGLGSVYNSCLNDLLGVSMSEPLFRMLRTEYQLGYSVYCQPVSTHGILGFVVVVECQANKFSMQQIDEIMEKFLTSFPKNLEDMSATKFQDMINTQTLIRSADDADLHDESHRFWQEITSQNYVFDRLKLEHNALNKMTKRALIDWSKVLITDKKRKLTLMIEGHCKGKKEFIPTHPEVGVKSIRNLLKNLNLGDNIQNVPINHPPQIVPNENESLIQLKDMGLNYITDINAFKSSLKEYPHHIILK